MKVPILFRMISRVASLTYYNSLISVFLILCLGFTLTTEEIYGQQSLVGKTIVLDPGHGGTAEYDDYRVGPAGEREEWVNLRVALKLEEMLKNQGSKVILTRRDDVEVPLQVRAGIAVEADADLFISIHHNATADPDVNFPIVYYHGYSSLNRASVELGQILICELNDTLFDRKAPMSLVSDRTIFPNSGTSVLRNSYGIPGVIVEASFFTNPEEEQRLRSRAYNRKEAEALLDGIVTFFDLTKDHQFDITQVNEEQELPPFAVFQEEERMSPEAMQWKENYKEGVRLFHKGGDENLKRAYDYLTHSVRAFADSPVAGAAHLYRAAILREQEETERAETEERRSREFYTEEVICTRR